MHHKQKIPSLVAGLFLSILSLSGAGCGKIGPLSLPEHPIPEPISDLMLKQLQTDIILSWTFPAQLKGNNLPFQIDELQFVEIWHTTKEPGKKPFEKLAKRIEKIAAKSLIQNDESRYTLKLPYKADQLDGQTHHFAIGYRYDGQNSDLSRTLTHTAQIPAQAIGDLSLQEEGRHVLLKWSQPRQDIRNKPIKELIGYNVYGQKRLLENWSEEKLLTPKPIIVENFEQSIGSEDGEYRYRVTALSAARIESEFSNPVEITLVDNVPPQSPGILICLAYQDHLILTWDGSTDSDLDQYRIFRKTNHTEPFTILAEGIKTKAYRDYDVKKGKTYYYLITALDKKGNESPESTIAEGKLE